MRERKGLDAAGAGRGGPRRRHTPTSKLSLLPPFLHSHSSAGGGVPAHIIEYASSLCPVYDKECHKNLDNTLTSAVAC